MYWFSIGGDLGTYYLLLNAFCACILGSKYPKHIFTAPLLITFFGSCVVPSRPTHILGLIWLLFQLKAYRCIYNEKHILLF